MEDNNKIVITCKKCGKEIAKSQDDVVSPLCIECHMKDYSRCLSLMDEVLNDRSN